MADTANNLANIGDAAPRRRGPPPGTPKPPNSGRKKGTRNRVTKEIAEIAQKHGKEIVDGLVKDFKATDDLDVKIKIASLVLSYGYGKPANTTLIGGDGGNPIRYGGEYLDLKRLTDGELAQLDALTMLALDVPAASPAPSQRDVSDMAVGPRGVLTSESKTLAMPMNSPAARSSPSWRISKGAFIVSERMGTLTRRSITRARDRGERRRQ